jgi:hypothetical protein
VCPLASILTFWFLAFWVSGKRGGTGGGQPPSSPAKPVNIFVFDWFSQEGVGGGGLFRNRVLKKLGFPAPSLYKNICADQLGVAVRAIKVPESRLRVRD